MKLTTEGRRLSALPEAVTKVIAYAAVGPDGNRQRAKKDLEEAVSEAGLALADVWYVLDEDSPETAARRRVTFRGKVVEILAQAGKRVGKGRGRKALYRGRGSVEASRVRLAQLDQAWELIKQGAAEPVRASASPDALEPVAPANQLEQDSTGAADPGGDGEEPSAQAKEKREVYAVVLRALGDLGPRADAIAQALALIVGAGAHVITGEEEIDTRKPRGRAAIEGILAAERAGHLVARAAAQARAENGRKQLRAYGRIPWGFRRAQEDRLEPVDDDLAVVKVMKEMELAGLAPGRIAATLNHGKRLGSRPQPWTDIAVRRILKNPIYEAVLGAS